MPLIVGYTGIKADTITLVNQISVKKKQYPEKMEKLFNAIVQLVEQAKVALQTNDYERLGKLMDFNQEYLRDLGVSSERLENLIDASKKSGAYGAKLSGAGVGDCMIALAPPDKTQAVKQAISEAGGQVIEIETNVEGVRVED
ncbi:MAG: Mevalonate kinase [Candidatus Gottesmanbacteria bacterium GW2011_GWC1_43_10]|nr:MAG: Mevalonate kinase [Candidatus Gottesmanbacteria bacterium GW2011_GWC1_43_10]